MHNCVCNGANKNALLSCRSLVALLSFVARSLVAPSSLNRSSLVARSFSFCFYLWLHELGTSVGLSEKRCLPFFHGFLRFFTLSTRVASGCCLYVCCSCGSHTFHTHLYMICSGVTRALHIWTLCFMGAHALANDCLIERIQAREPQPIHI